MRKTIGILLAVVFITACNASKKTSAVSDAPNVLSKSESKEGWKLMYDGQTTKGWHVYLNRTDGSAWKSVDGTLMFDPSNKADGKIVGGGDLVSDGVYENFHLSLEWKISVNGNSGIIFLSQEDAKYTHSYLTGPEMQVLHNDGHPDGKITKHRAGDLYDLIQSSSEPVKAPGEWNKAEIRIKNRKLDLYLNGVNVVSTTMGDENWNKLIAGSKFKSMPDFAKFTKGHIVLQDHGNQVWFRNIKVREI
ncbi:MAG TPA: DUF1080 domain-containing protein [Chitinophagaceae bacterium]|nr:DUF1080 domain-containing protein [Chitinophagaceae bacterium]